VADRQLSCSDRQAGHLLRNQGNRNRLTNTLSLDDQCRRAKRRIGANDYRHSEDTDCPPTAIGPSAAAGSRIGPVMARIELARIAAARRLRRSTTGSRQSAPRPPPRLHSNAAHPNILQKIQLNDSYSTRYRQIMQTCDARSSQKPICLGNPLNWKYDLRIEAGTARRGVTAIDRPVCSASTTESCSKRREN